MTALEVTPGQVPAIPRAASLSAAPDQFVQGSAQWHRARCGKVTASRIGDVIARTKTGWAAARANYLAELLAERLTGDPAASFTSAAMQWGKDWEEEARRAYAFRCDRDVEPVGFVPHPDIAMSGASPDGLVGEDGLVEIKAPNTATHLDLLIADELPPRYRAQIMWQMACTGRLWCDFVCYDPRLPEHLRLIVRRIPRDDHAIAELEDQVRQFLGELEARIADLDRRVRRPAAAAADVHTLGETFREAAG